MDLSQKISLGLVAAFGAVTCLAVFSINHERSARAAEVAQLRNRLAERDKTIEIQDGVYTKLAQDRDDLEKLVNDKSKENVALLQQIKADKEKIAEVTGISIYWKGQYEQAVIGTSIPAPDNPSVVPVPGSPKLFDLSSGRVDFGLVSVLCNVRTSEPPAFKIDVGPGKSPLGLKIALTQDRDGSWRSYATSSDPRIGLNITDVAIDTSLFSVRWYEKLSLHLDLGYGGADQVNGPILGIGASYRFGKFDLGPRVWWTATDRVRSYYGIGFSWYPFTR